MSRLTLLCAASEMGLCIPILLKLCGATGKALSGLPGVAVMAMALPFDQILSSAPNAAWRSVVQDFVDSIEWGAINFDL